MIMPNRPTSLTDICRHCNIYSGSSVEAATCGRRAQEKELHRHELNIKDVLHQGIFGVVYTGCLRGDKDKTLIVIKMLKGKVWATKER